MKSGHDTATASLARAGGSPRVRPRSALVLEPATARLLYGEEGLGEIARMSELIARIDVPSSLAREVHQLAQVEVLFTGWGCPRLDETILDAAPNLRAIFFAGGSIRAFITEAVWARGLIVVNAAAVNAIPVAEYTLATILFSLKRGWHYIGRQHRERGCPGPIIASPGAYRSTIGLISLGAIARRVCDRLRTCDLEILACDPLVSATEAAALGVSLVGLDELFQRCDVVSLHTPLLPETEGMITGAHFEQMKPGSTFINTARGRIVREAEMTAVLERRPEVTAVLDVWAEAESSGNHPLFRLPNVFVTPHIAGSLGRECQRMGESVLADYRRWLRDEPLQAQVSRERAIHLA
jgi:phosphoglycerate dehydrogenase-like enzyme